MTQGPIDSTTTEQQDAISALKSECRGKMLLTAAVMLALTVCAAGLLSLNPSFDFWEAATLAGFFAMLTLAALLNRIETKYKTAARNTPELLPPGLDDATLAAWMEADQRYITGRKRMKSERNLTLIAGFALTLVIPVAFLFAILIASIRWRVQSAALGEQPLTPLSMTDRAIEKSSLRLQFASFVLWLLVLFWMMFLSMFRYTAHSKATSLNADAKAIYNAAYQYQVDLAYEGKDNRFETTIAAPGDTGEEGSLQWGIQLYCSSAEHYWYAIVCDSDGTITAAYCSRSELTENNLHPQTLDEQIELFSTPFRGDKAIGYYEYTPNTTEVNTYG